MKSPFPGMDPYLEAHWQDVHASLVHNARNVIQRQLRGGLRARIGERLVVEEEWEVKRSLARGVTVSEYEGGGATAVLEAPRAAEPAAGVNLVEIDLTRRGQPVFKFDPSALPTSHRTPYLAAVWRAVGRYKRHEVYRIPLRERLPAIRIPLRPEDQDVVLDLQELVARAYEEGRYDDIDYSRPLDPPLAEDDGQWAGSLISAPVE